MKITKQKLESIIKEAVEQSMSPFRDPSEDIEDIADSIIEVVTMLEGSPSEAGTAVGYLDEISDRLYSIAERLRNNIK